MMQALTGHPTVDAISQIQFEGNLIPHSWYRHIRYENKRGVYSDHLACLILADIVYWYRPVAVRDEVSGEVVSWKKKFAEDKLRRSTDAFADTLGATPRQIRASMALLEELNLIEVELRSVHTALGTMPNLMFISLNPQAIMDISYRPKKATTLEKSLLPKSVTSSDEMGNKALRNGEQGTTKSVTSSDEMGNSSIYRDYIEITPEITRTDQEHAREKIEPEAIKESTGVTDIPVPDAHSTSLQDPLQTSRQPENLSLGNYSGAAALITKDSRTPPTPVQPRNKFIHPTQKTDDRFRRKLAPWRNSDHLNDFKEDFLRHLMVHHLPYCSPWNKGKEVSDNDAKDWITNREYDYQGIAAIENKWANYQSKLQQAQSIEETQKRELEICSSRPDYSKMSDADHEDLLRNMFAEGEESFVSRVLWHSDWLKYAKTYKFHLVRKTDPQQSTIDFEATKRMLFGNPQNSQRKRHGIV